LFQHVSYVPKSPHLTYSNLVSGIKAPKGEAGYFVPILANPDIVSRYQENIVDTLHKKNLLLLGEDRYLSTLMLKTFPRRKQIFVPQAICKTIVPDSFKVLLSQRRRWINSTVHNLMELVLVRDLCGTFCLSMQVSPLPRMVVNGSLSCLSSWWGRVCCLLPSGSQFMLLSLRL
jgi:Chitin synthase